MMSSRYIVLLDLGNSFAKISYLHLANVIMQLDNVDAVRANIAALDSDSFSHSIRIDNKLFDVEQVVSSLSDNNISIEQVAYVLVSSVRSNEFNGNLQEQLIKKINRAKVCFCSAKKQYQQLINHYQDIDKLGIDRWLAAIAVTAIAEQNLRNSPLNKNTNKTGSIIVDAGSAVTIDFVENNDKAYHYHGGKILPGLNKMTQSLSQTDKLPWVDISDNNANIMYSSKVISSSTLQGFGLNTQDAIIAGVKSAIKGALLQTIEELQRQGYCELNVYVTGGDAGVYESLIGQCNLLIKPHLVFVGMLLSNIDDLYAASD